MLEFPESDGWKDVCLKTKVVRGDPERQAVM